MNLLNKKSPADWLDKRIKKIEQKLKSDAYPDSDNKSLLNDLELYKKLLELKSQVRKSIDPNVVIKCVFGFGMLITIIKFEKEDSFTPGSKTFSIFQKFIGG